jgi:hypothetical protein
MHGATLKNIKDKGSTVITYKNSLWKFETYFPVLYISVFQQTFQNIMLPECLLLYLLERPTVLCPE